MAWNNLTQDILELFVDSAGGQKWMEEDLVLMHKVNGMTFDYCSGEKARRRRASETAFRLAKIPARELERCKQCNSALPEQQAGVGGRRRQFCGPQCRGKHDYPSTRLLFGSPVP